MTRKKSLPPLLEWGAANLILPGQTVSGDLSVVQQHSNGAMVAVVDGLGHGAEAAVAAERAIATMQAHAHESLLQLVKRCHEALRETRGVVLTMATFSEVDQTLFWLGIGNVEAILLRADPQSAPAREYVLLHGGVVGLQLPPLRGFVIPVSRGDTLIMATDGIRSGFAEGISLDQQPPQRLADQILARHAKRTDDALVLVARYLGGEP